MNNENNEQVEYLLLKINTPKGRDFYEEHKAIIDDCGFVDFAKFGRSVLKYNLLEEGDIIYIKESIANGGQLYSAVFERIVQKGSKYPDYYRDYDNINVIWLRLSELKQIPLQVITDNYLTRAGGSVAAALKSMSPNFYIHRKNTR